MSPQSEDAPPQAKEYKSAFQEHWEGWIKSVGLMALLVAGYFVYKEQIVGEGVAGVVVILLIVGVAIGSVVPQAWGFLRKPNSRGLFVAFCAAWALATLYPPLRLALPVKPLAEAQLTAEQKTATVNVPGGSYEVTVSGQFKELGASDTEASYNITAEGGGATDEVAGELKRELVHLRTSRRGGMSTSLQEHTEATHRLEHVHGDQIKFTVDDVDEKLADGLHLSVHSAGANPWLFVILGALAVLCAIGFDAKLIDFKGRPAKTYLATAAGTTYAFALWFPHEATPHRIVRPAVGSLVFGLFVGGLTGLTLAFITRIFIGPKVKKTR